MSRHRGRHPLDRDLFGAEALPSLRRAAADLSWLLGRGYRDRAAVKLVGDRFALRTRQRRALLRAAAADDDLADRARRRLALAACRDEALIIDGFNCLITVEAALAGGAVVVGLDGAHRDMASVHGSYRRVEETDAAIEAIGERLAEARPASALWLLDRPVSNSGRLAARLRRRAEARGWPWRVEAVESPDRDIIARRDAAVAASSDSWILDSCDRWVDLPGAVIERLEPRPWVIDLRGG